MIQKIRFKIWSALSQLVDLVHPGYLTAEATVGRVQAFHDLLHDTKMNTPEASLPSPDPSEILQDQSAKAQAAEQRTHEDAAKEIRNAFMREGRLSELADIVLDLGPFQSADHVPARVLQQATAVFIKRYTRQLRLLIGIKSDTAS
jgi:hypothetical protein